ncbi:unnamed protein product [Symbiodinium sp. CCMP2592]|nr:unnamed protein product [Symbiodinium sp. CCMP2592]
MNNMMQRLMQDQNRQQQDPIPNMQYFAPGGGQAGATTMGQGPAAGTQAPAAATQQAPAGASASVQQTALVAATNASAGVSPAVQLEMSDPENDEADEAEVLRQAGLVADAVNKKKGILKKPAGLPKAKAKAKAHAKAKAASKASAVLKEVAACPEVLDSASRRGIKRARDSELEAETPHGPLVAKITVPVEVKSRKAAGDEEVKIVPTELPILNLMAWIWHVCQSMPGVAAFFQRQLSKYPCTATSPWRMALYNDEISPGNQLKASNTRKIQGYYLSFLEFDAEGRCQENLWFPLNLTRSSVVNKIQGGLSALTHILVSSESFLNLQSGCLLNMPTGERVMFFAKLHTVVADEAALKSMYDFKGSSGTLVCPLCANITSKTHGDLPANDHSGELHDISCIDSNLFVRRTDNQIFTAQALLARRQPMLSKKDFALLESSMGLNFNPSGVLAHKSMPLVKCLMWDWMHCYVVSVLLHVEASLLLPLLHVQGATFQVIQSFISEYEWPHNLKNRRREILHLFDKRSKPSEFKAGASQCITVYPLLRLFLLTHHFDTMDDELRRCIRSFMKICMVLDLLLECNRTGNLSADELENAIRAHSQAFLKAYGEQHCIPKFHYSLHLPLMARDRPLISCFTHERKHRQVKQFADNTKKVTDWFEASLFKDVLGRALLDLSEHAGFMRPHLKSPKSVTDGALLWHLGQTFGFQTLEHVQSAMLAEVCPGQTCERGDLVLLKTGSVAEVWLFCRLQHGELLALLSVLEPQGKNLFRVKQDGAQFMRVAEISRTCLFKRMSADSMLVVP